MEHAIDNGNGLPAPPFNLSYGIEEALAEDAGDLEPVAPLVGSGAFIDYAKLPAGDYLTQVFQMGGILQQASAHYEYRPGQEQMARAVHEALFTGRHCLVDAPCGIGKSVAYSIPAIANAVTNGLRIVIATENIALQEQLYDSDLPSLQRTLACFPFTFALLKGRNNYWCKERALKTQIDDSKKQLSQTQLRELNRLTAWSKSTADGDRSHVPFSFSPGLWQLVSCGTEDCKGQACSAHSICFYEKAKLKALASQVVVTNYHMLLRGLFSSTHLEREDQSKPRGLLHVSLGGFHALILDEAHNLAKVARDCLGFTLSQAAINQLRKWVLTTKNKETAQDIAQQLIDSAHLFFAEASRAAADPQRQDCRLIKDGWTRGTERGLSEALSKVTHLAETYAKQTALSPEVRADAANAHKKASTFRTNLLNAARLAMPDKMVYWVDVAPTRAVKIESKPLEVGPFLRSMLYGRLHSVVLTSATLALGDSFAFIKEEVGLEALDAIELTTKTPFDFAQQCWISVPKDMPAVGTKEYQPAAAWLVAEIIKIAGGRTLCLFSSNAQLNAIHRDVSNSLKGLPIKLLLQRQGISRKKLREDFKADVSSCLFGVSSFWTGVDVPGEALTGLVIDKLPFPNIKDPLYKARETLEKKRGAFFNDWAVPTMLVTLRQGIGRLIRRADDYGFITLLDSRVWTKSYGQRVRRALPHGIQWMHSLDELKHAIQVIDAHRATQRVAGM